MSVFRGVVVISIPIVNEYGDHVQGERIIHTKPYKKASVARCQTTIIANGYNRNYVIDKYIEIVTAWRRCD